MGDRLTGTTADTPGRMVVDAGVLFRNYGLADEDPFGATQEGVTFAVEQTMRQVPIDGFRGPMKGARRVTQEVARLTGNIMELTTDNLSSIITDAAVTEHTKAGASSKTHNQVQRQSNLPKSTDYLENIALVGQVQGSAESIVIVLFNALSDGGMEIETSDESEGTLGIQFTAHFDPTDPNTAPYAIRFPSDVDEEGNT